MISRSASIHISPSNERFNSR